MFEKEAKEYADKVYGNRTEMDHYGIADAFQEGAEFGYNKANEWHYMKDVNRYEDLPQNKDVYYAYVINVGEYDKPTIERRLGCFAEFEYDVMAYHVIAWKEIVLPELTKGSE
jgi:hypothetical protein